MKFDRYKELIKMAWPLIIANSFWNLQLTVDRIFLGMLSTEALGAAMAVMGVFWVPMALLQQTSSYLTTFVAQYFGANEKDKIPVATWQAFYVSILGGLLFIGLNSISSTFFSFVGHSSPIQSLEVDYFNALSFSALPAALVAAISGLFTGLGHTQVIIGINLVGLLVNIILDYVMIFGYGSIPAMGVKGAGYATALANYASVIYGLYLIYKLNKKYNWDFFKQTQIKFQLMKQFLKYGLPSGLQWALEGLAFTVFLIIIGRMTNGEAALASSSIAVTIMMLSVLPSMGVAQAVMTLVGQNLGSGQPDKAEYVTWTGVRLVIVYILCVAASFIIIPEFYISWFRNEENIGLWTNVQSTTIDLLKIVALFTLFDSLYLNISFALKGAGDTRFVSLIALVMPWPFMVLPAYFVKDWPNAVIWAWSFCVLYSLAITMSLLLRFRQGKWKSMKVISE